MKQIVLQIVLILLNAIFAATEIAVISMNDQKMAKMADDGDRKAKRLVNLTSQPSKFLATIQVAITLSGFLGSAFAADNFSSQLTGLIMKTGIGISEKTISTISVVIITILLSYFTLIFGELVPKRVAMKNAEKLALAISGLITFVSKIFAPIVWFLTLSTNVVLKLLGIDPNANEEEVTEEEIRMMLDQGREKGTIDENEKEIIDNVFDFDDTQVETVFTHRKKVDFISTKDDIDEWKRVIYRNIHTKYPVCGENFDDIIGVLDAKKYFRLENKTRENILNECVSPAYFVPETVAADVLFKNMKQSGNHFAIVLDEYGGMCGVITMTDLVEELVGEIDL